MDTGDCMDVLSSSIGAQRLLMSKERREQFKFSLLLKIKVK